MTLNLKSLFLVPVLALLAACGGGGDDAPATPTTPAAPTVVSIAVTPANPILAIGGTQKMVATGTYSDGKVSAITSGVTWTVKGPALSVAADGTITAKTLGSDTVTAAVGAVSGIANVTVKGQWAAVAAGGRHNVARHLDGNLYAWGSNLQGQLGDNTTIGRSKPAVVAGANTTWRQIAAGEFHTLALRADGSLWAWGFNQNGQLGDGTSADKLVPTRIGTGKWLYVAAGKAHSLGIDDKGALWAWGRNFNGQLGDATVLPRLAPVKLTVAGTATWTAVAAGDTHSLGRRSDGTVWAWGGNTSGQLGNGDATGANLTAPVQIGTQSWASISAGGSHSAAIRADGTLWTWGSNSNGQIGNNTLLDQIAPVQIGTSTGWTSVAAGGQHSIGMMLDNTLWTWGLNADGQLGNGQNTDQRVPVLVVHLARRAAQLWLWKELKLAVEPAAALGLAALQTGAYKPQPQETVALILCGANFDPTTLA
eukprot:gene39120-48314_t